jgi:hypothetical protein
LINPYINGIIVPESPPAYRDIPLPYRVSSTVQPLHRIIKILFVLSLGLPAAVYAGNLALFGGQGADVNLPDIIPKLLKGEIDMDPTRFWGINYSRDIPMEGRNSFTKFLLDRRIAAEWEVQLTKHRGLQDNYESPLAVLLRSHDLELGSLAAINFAAGTGFSYAYSDPVYEDGPDGQPGTGDYPFQNYVTFEIELSTPALPNWSLATRVHHRSGIYGLIAPRKVGSNFFAMGIRYAFR